MRKMRLVLPALALSLLLGCGEKQPPATTNPGTGLDGGGLTPIGDGLTPIGGASTDPGTFNPDDNIDPGVDPGTDPGVDPGTDPGVDPGTDPGVDPGVDPGTDPGVEPTPDPGASVDPGAEPTPAPTATPTAEPTAEPTFGAPISVQASDVEFTSFSLSWVGSEDAVAYQIYLDGALKVDNVNGESYTLSGLTSGKTYSVTVVALDEDDNESDPSTAINVTTTSIGAPSALTQSNLTHNSVKVSWTGTDDANSYRVYLNGSRVADNITAKTYTFTGLNAQTTYRIQISAQTDEGESAKSSELRVTTPERPDEYGNAKLGFLTMTAMESPNGLDVKNGHAYVGFYQFVDGFFSDDHNRIWRDMNIASGQVVDRIVSEGNAAVKISGIAVNGSEVWISLSEKDDDGFMLYRYNTSGTRLNRYSFNLNGITTKDIAVDADTGMVYLSVGLSTSSILRFDPLRYQNNPADPESVMFMFGGAPLVDPVGLDVDNDGNVYAFDSKTRKLIKFSKSDGSRLLEFGPAGVNGTGPSYTAVSDVAIDPRNGEIYITGNSSGEIMIFRYDSNGNFIRSFKDGDLTSPTKMSIDSDGKVHVIDSVKKGVLVFGAGTRP